jgi:outer membrane protein TolC
MASYQMAFVKNPDYMIRQQQVSQEKLRVAYLKNQKLPQLDLKGSFGLNGLSRTPDGSLSDMARQDYPAWSLGMELRVPLGGGIKEKNDLEAGRLGKIRALSSLKEAEVQMLNSIDGARRKIDLHRSSLTNARSVVDFHEKLLKAQLDRLAVGSIDSRAVLETEEKLLEARIAIIESMVMERKAWVELEVVRGSFLEARSAEIDLLAMRAKARQKLAQGFDARPAQPTVTLPEPRKGP